MEAGPIWGRSSAYGYALLFPKFNDPGLCFIAFAVTYFARYRTPAISFDTIAGRNDGLRRIVLAAGQLAASERGPLHPDELSGPYEKEARIRLVTDAYKLRAARLDVATAYRTIAPEPQPRQSAWPNLRMQEGESE